MTSSSARPTDDGHCFVCGKNNPCGIGAIFSRSCGRVSAEFIPAGRFQGYADVTHGGVVAALLDEAMTQAAIVEAELTVRSGRPIEAGSRILRRADRRVVTEASAKLIPSK